ncbi:MAG: antibiotic biosynthesis monooxygenase [Muribaculaceae bacterium]|nr:antibiotic biosynthesis monooxygenase [Muribaculaceae bacterium]
MIRLNAFFVLKDDVAPETVVTLARELVEKSRNDKGCVAYDLFQSATNPSVMMFCETWADDQSLKTHTESAHFTELVPKIEAMTKSGLKLERFEF